MNERASPPAVTTGQWPASLTPQRAGNSAQTSPQHQSVAPPAGFGGFCGSLVGRSATFYSSRRNVVSLTVSFPVTSTVSMATAGVFLHLPVPQEGRHSSRQLLLRRRRFPGPHCDRVLTDCHERKCRVRSPNYPGFYTLGTSPAHYHVRQAQVPAGRVAQLIFQQRNEYKISVHTGLPNAGGVLYKRADGPSARRTSSCRYRDGASESNQDSGRPNAISAGSGQLPRVVSSGPDATVRIISVPYPAAPGFPGRD
ncbi:hypothetical protein HPB48_003359 [Haemaphysalis longicornis]|uniref:Uncharacterized protein n=1 Tax=Haemaphysalis longicornis TaxID=44386 RepID=A0A9J6GWI7_HAELO|nr:hypothetical protein HPB48_003359 [Haemaphysalis longicornis]